MAVETETISLYKYQPNVSIAIVSAILFLAATIVQLWQLTRYPAWQFWAMYFGLLMECVGFIALAYSVCNTTNSASFVISYITLILAPSFTAAACYSTFGRFVWWVTPPNAHRFRLLWFPSRFVTIIFVLFDLGSFFIQLLGAGAMGTAYSSETLPPHEQEEKARKGLAALRLGLGLQMICFGAFAIVSTKFLIVSRCWGKMPLRYTAASTSSRRHLIWVVYVSAILLMVRAIYRLVEFSGSRSQPSYVQLHEWPFWTFDAVPMLSIAILFAIVYPGKHLPPEFLGVRLNRRQLRNVAASSPPTYIQANPEGSAHAGGWMT